jgi:hypothetical protein
VFPGAREGKPLSNMAMLMMLRRMGRDDLTAHGFRSSFRDWAAETTGYPGDLVEMALAHVVSNATEAAYRRGDMFDKRRRLMARLGGYCETTIRKLKRELGSTARSSLDVTSTLRFAIRRAGLEHAAHLDSRMNKKLALEVLVHHLTKAWLELADEAFDQLRIGHPDHPGPFLKFLSASADGMPGGITLNSLHAKARELAGRRG